MEVHEIIVELPGLWYQNQRKLWTKKTIDNYTWWVSRSVCKYYQKSFWNVFLIPGSKANFVLWSKVFLLKNRVMSFTILLLKRYHHMIISGVTVNHLQNVKIIYLKNSQRSKNKIEHLQLKKAHLWKTSS